MTHEIRIVAFDGQISKEIAYIKVGSKDVVAGYLSRTGDDTFHMTYPPNGELHTTHCGIDGPNRDLRVRGPPLDEFRGFVSLFQGQINRPLSRFPDNPTFGSGKRDSVIFIDTRNADSHTSFKPYLLEPGYPFTKVLNHPATEFDADYFNYHVSTSTEPWIGVSYWCVSDEMIEENRGVWLHSHSNNFDVINPETGEPYEPPFDR